MLWTSDYFKEKQEQLRLSNAKMAKKLGISVCYVEFMRNGRRPPSNPVIRKMEKLLEERAADPVLSFL